MVVAEETDSYNGLNHNPERAVSIPTLGIYKCALLKKRLFTLIKLRILVEVILGYSKPYNRKTEGCPSNRKVCLGAQIGKERHCEDMNGDWMDGAAGRGMPRMGSRHQQIGGGPANM